MKFSTNVYLSVACLVTVGYALAVEPPNADQEVAEKAIRASADAFVEAVKKRDAAAIAAQWTEDGVYIDQDNRRFAGRKAIQAEYELLLKEAPEGVELRIEIGDVGPEDRVRLALPFRQNHVMGITAGHGQQHTPVLENPQGLVNSRPDPIHQ